MDIENQVLELFKESMFLGHLGDKEVTLDDRFKEDLELDSLDQVEFCMEVEQAFAIEIVDDELDELNCLRDYVNYLQGKLVTKH